MTITRFAPSPTGFLHIGGLRTALYNYLWAKKNCGEFKLRIEDTDLKRNSKEAVDAILKAFDWVGMPSDCKIEYQSKRFDIYKKYIDKLIDEKKAYYCYMGKDELDKLRQEQIDKGLTPRYDRRWRPEDNKKLPDIPDDIEPVVRIKAPLSGKIEFYDGIKGDMSFDANFVDDFIIARSDKTPTYNFVVAIDDALMEITDVIRGDDHLSNTPKQIVIYNALGFKIPKFYHIPMILNEKGKKLSKRDGATDVMEYKKMGYLPEALLNFLVRLGWSYKDKEIFTFEELIDLFDPNDINKSASSYNIDKLNWLNNYYIKNSSNEKLITLLKDFGIDLTDVYNKDFIINLYKDRVNTIVELSTQIKNLLKEPVEYESKGVKKFIKENSIDLLKEYIELLENNNIKSIDDIENLTKPFIDRHNLKFPQIFQPIRISLVGSTKAPSVYELIYAIGINESIKRIKKAIKNNFEKQG